MKITLEFRDEEQARDALDGTRWRSVVVSVLGRVRERLKYGGLDLAVDSELTALRDEIYDMLRDERLGVD